MKNSVCALFAKDFERRRVSRFCSENKSVFLSCLHTSLGWRTCFIPVVGLQILRGHGGCSSQATATGSSVRAYSSELRVVVVMNCFVVEWTQLRSWATSVII